MQWLLKLLPKQKMQEVGEGSIQAGRVGGDLNHSQNTDNSRTVVNHNTTVLLMGSPGLAPTSPTVSEKDGQAEADRLAVLKLMRESETLKARARAFMKREFGDALVKALDGKQAFRTRRYLETCLERDGSQNKRHEE